MFWSMAPQDQVHVQGYGHCMDRGTIRCFTPGSAVTVGIGSCSVTLSFWGMVKNLNVARQRDLLAAPAGRKPRRAASIYIYGPIARKLYRVPSAPKRARKPMKERCIRLNFYWNLLLNYLPPLNFFSGVSQASKFLANAIRRSKNVVFSSFFKKVGG